MITAYMMATTELIEDLNSCYPDLIKVLDKDIMSDFKIRLHFTCDQLPEHLDGHDVFLTIYRIDGKPSVQFIKAGE